MECTQHPELFPRCFGLPRSPPNFTDTFLTCQYSKIVVVGVGGRKDSDGSKVEAKAREWGKVEARSMFRYHCSYWRLCHDIQMEARGG